MLLKNKLMLAVIQGIQLFELNPIATIGVGGFGKVTLVKWRKDSNRVFALKSCSKDFVKMSQQETHVNNERIVRVFLRTLLSRNI